MKSTLRALLLAVLLLQAAAHPAGAMEEWCDDDPPIVIRTPAGRLVPVYVTNGALGAQHLTAAQLARISYAVQPIPGASATRVTVSVAVPGDLWSSSFSTRTSVSTGPMKTGTVYGTATGSATQTMVVSFRLDQP